MAADPATLARDHRWLPHAIDLRGATVEFVRLERADHRAMTFLDDKYLAADVPRATVEVRALAEAMRGLPRRPLHFVFHSSFCLSTLAIRLFDQPGVAMGLKEPFVLTRLATLKRRGMAVGPLLDLVLTLLARPFAEGEAVVVKPSNVANLLIAELLSLRPQARAALLYCPLRDFLISVAKKGMWGRIEARRLFALLQGDGLTEAGLSREELFLHTDMQVTAQAWLGHQREFAALLAGPAAARLRTLDSAGFAANKPAAAQALAAHLGVPLDPALLAASGVYDQHAKELGRGYDSDARDREAAAVAVIHGDEADMVSRWAEALAVQLGVPMVLPRPLLGT